MIAIIYVKTHERRTGDGKRERISGKEVEAESQPEEEQGGKAQR